MKHKSSILLLAIALLTGGSVLLSGCSEKIVSNGRSQPGEIHIMTQMAPSLRPALGVSSYLLTVTGHDMDTVVSLLSIDDDGGSLTGTAADIPYGVDRKFAVRGVNITPVYDGGTLKYDTSDVLRGEAYADVIPAAPVDLNMQLVPVAPIFYFNPRYVKTDWQAPFSVDLRMYNLDSVAEIEGEVKAYDMEGDEVILVDSLVRGVDVNQNVTLSRQAGWFLFQQDTTIDNRVPLFPQNLGGNYLRAYMTVRYDKLAIPVDTVQLQLFLYGITRVDRQALPRQPIYVDYARIEVRRAAGAAVARILQDNPRQED